MRRIAVFAIVLTSLSPAFAAPATLTCAENGAFDWRSGTFAPGEAAADGTVVLHLSPTSGEWFLQRAGSAALTSDGGTFAIVREGLAGPWDEWVGSEGETMLRIGGDEAPYPFLFVSERHGVLTGACIAPEEPFLFLRGRE